MPFPSHSSRPPSIRTLPKLRDPFPSHSSRTPGFALFPTPFATATELHPSLRVILARQVALAAPIPSRPGARQGPPAPAGPSEQGPPVPSTRTRGSHSGQGPGRPARHRRPAQARATLRLGDHDPSQRRSFRLSEAPCRPPGSRCHRDSLDTHFKRGIGQPSESSSPAQGPGRVAAAGACNDWPVRRVGIPFAPPRGSQTVPSGASESQPSQQSESRQSPAPRPGAGTPSRASTGSLRRPSGPPPLAHDSEEPCH
jgi:hypothetical protein